MKNSLDKMAHLKLVCAVARFNFSKSSRPECPVEEVTKRYAASSLVPFGPRLCPACMLYQRQNNGNICLVKVTHWQLSESKAANVNLGNRKWEDLPVAEVSLSSPG